VYKHRNFVADYSTETEFYLKTKKRFLRHFCGRTRHIRTLYIACWKAHGRLPLRHDWTFFAISYGWKLRRYRRKSVEVGVFFRRGINLNANFRPKGALPTTHGRCQKTRVIALSCGVEISAIHCLILLQITVWQTDRQTDIVIDRIRTPKTALPIVASRGKNERTKIKKNTISFCCRQSRYLYKYGIF